MKPWINRGAQRPPYPQPCMACGETFTGTLSLACPTCKESKTMDEERDDDGTTYKIVRFRFKGANEVQQTGLTLAEAQARCQGPDTQGNGWFDGYTEED